MLVLGTPPNQILTLCGGDRFLVSGRCERARKPGFCQKPGFLISRAKLIRHRTDKMSVLRGKFSANIFAYLLNSGTTDPETRFFGKTGFLREFLPEDTG